MRPLSIPAPLAGVPGPPPPPGGLALELVLFRLGGLGFAVESAQVQGLAPGGETGALALAELLGIGGPGSPPTAGRGRLLRLRLAAPGAPEPPLVRPLLVRVEEPVEIRRVPAARLHPLPGLIAATSALPCVRGLALWGGDGADGLAILLDLRRLPGLAAGLCPVG